MEARTTRRRALMLVLVAMVALSFVVPPVASAVLRLASIAPALPALASVLTAQRQPGARPAA